jgi:hypothetical protein
MTNRQRVIEAYEAKATKRLREEVDYFMDTYFDEAGYDTAEAVNDAMRLAERSGDRSTARDCINVLIEAGYYQPREGEVAIMGRDRAPVRKGVRYDCADAWCVWIKK